MRKIDTPVVHEVLRPIWTSKPETASRVRQRIEAVLDYAKAMGAREGDNQPGGAAISPTCCRSPHGSARFNIILRWIGAKLRPSCRLSGRARTLGLVLSRSSY